MTKLVRIQVIYIHEYRFKVILKTNGGSPVILHSLIKSKLVDKVRVEFMSPLKSNLFSKITMAGTFFKEPKSLMDSISQRYEEEKMAIIIMELVGKNHNDIFYPSISGVCQSYNYYPVSYMQRKDGVTFLALGLGKTIAEGGKSLRYCPKYPNILSQFYSIKSSINNSQNKFYALDLNKGKNPMENGEKNNLKLFDLNIAENNGELKHLASVITPNDNIMRDSLSYKGTRILSFSSIIKYEKNPLNKILMDLIKKGEKLIGCPI